MNGPLKCGWGCGFSFYNADEQLAHERACPRRPARTGSRPSDGDVAGAMDAAVSRSRAA